MLPVMLQLWNVRDDLSKDFDGTFEEIAKAGYKYVELAYAQGYGKTASEIKASIEKAGLKAMSAHDTFRGMMADPERAVDFHMEIGCKYIVIPFLSNEDRHSGPNYETTKKEIAQFGELVNKKGAALLYHNHEFEFEDYKGKFALDDLYDSIPANLLKTQIDICWAKLSGVDPAGYILKYKGRAPVVHLKDFDASKGGAIKAEYELLGEAKKARASGAFPFCPIGYGIQNIPSVIKAVEAAGTEWLVVEQDSPSPGKTSIQNAKESLDYLKGLDP
ncbi:MAG: sugar phosphate isomerase/epimerase [Treponema sp.]|nr:sugar phosphate isomerase/epimerase [Treponema sp.]